VNSIFQDSRGFLWLGTEDGLNRYDGYDLTIYEHDPTDPWSLPNDTVWSIAEDGAGDLWVATEGGGVARWDHARDRFVRYRHPEDERERDQVRTLHVAADGKVWLGTRERGLEVLDPETGKVRSFRHDPQEPTSLSHDSVFAIVGSRLGGLWVGTDGGLDRFDPASGGFEHVSLPAAGEEPSAPRVRALLEARNGELWIGTSGGGLIQLDPAGRRHEVFRHDPRRLRSLPHDVVRALLEDEEGSLWVGTAGGLAHFERRASHFHTYRHDSGRIESLADDYVMSLYQDRGGLIWVGTRSGGVSRWDPDTRVFGRHAPSDGGLSHGTVTSFAPAPDGVLWIGTLGGGLHRFDRRSGAMERFDADPADPGALSSDRVSALLLDRGGSLWVGTLDGGLNRLDPGAPAFRVYRHDPDRPGSLAADGVTSLLEDVRGVLWVGTFGGGLQRFDPRTGGFEGVPLGADGEEGLSSPKVLCLAEDPRGAVWIGTDGGGLDRFDWARRSFSHVRHRPDDAESLGSDTVFSLYVDPRGVVWAGTRGGGLTRLEPEAGLEGGYRARRYGKADGLPNGVVYGVQPDEQGRLWMSTNRGLARLDPESDEIEAWDVAHGLQQNEFTFGAHARGPNGELFFGGIDGFNAFFPHRLRTAERPPPLALTAVLVLNRPVPDLPPPWTLDRMELSYRNQVVTLELAAFDFAAPEHNRYSYRLEGLDSDWIDLGEYRRVIFTHLDPGTYTFRARATNHDGTWTDEEVRLEIEVPPPPWLSWWSYLGYSVLVGLGLVGFVGYQRRRLGREEAYTHRLEDEVRERTDELAAKNLELEKLNRELHEASLCDSLTGLRNRRFLFQHIEAETALVERRYAQVATGSPVRVFDLVFMMLDIDNFKAINDTCGHVAGDEFLVQLRSLLEDTCRKSDMMIRWGGDELLVVGRDSNPGEAERMADRIRRSVHENVFTASNGYVVRATCSIGFACYPFVRSDPKAYSWEDVLLLADTALYLAKRSGRDAWVGLVSEEATPPHLLPMLRHEPKRAVAEGLVGVRASLPAEKLVWE
jgi:diguanylate cyclase (GGDEF)-like protein